MVYNGKPYLNGWYGGKTHHLRKHPTGSLKLQATQTECFGPTSWFQFHQLGMDLAREPFFFSCLIWGGSLAKQTTKPTAAPKKVTCLPCGNGTNIYTQTRWPVRRMATGRLRLDFKMFKCSFHNIHIYMFCWHVFFTQLTSCQTNNVLSFLFNNLGVWCFFVAVPITTDMFYSWKNLGPLIFFAASFNLAELQSRSPRRKRKAPSSRKLKSFMPCHSELKAKAVYQTRAEKVWNKTGSLKLKLGGGFKHF